MMRTLFSAAAILTVAVTQAAAFQGKCLLEVNGHAYIKGPCKVDVEKGGGFYVSTGAPMIYFARVGVDGQTAEGFWNEEPGATHAHSPLGTLTRDGACWSNKDAKVCAWR